MWAVVRSCVISFLSTPYILLVFQMLQISIHALRVEGDVEDAAVQEFLGISIHALRVEGDSAGC